MCLSDLMPSFVIFPHYHSTTLTQQHIHCDEPSLPFFFYDPSIEANQQTEDNLFNL